MRICFSGGFKGPTSYYWALGLGAFFLELGLEAQSSKSDDKRVPMSGDLGLRV